MNLLAWQIHTLSQAGVCAAFLARNNWRPERFFSEKDLENNFAN